ncbi:MAG TPA: 4-(cytidine 5'-diphospho)-2-C-methyl-D-erythritol kinase [Xanthomonadaceae bacterium]|jgi:4-diphosphocytidyl-2-C-methyl-D-erythritol kinase|nr:4-(cytidine 5'-diphospho)-2-C-methyl-D-erythritol kinase [Xanthomonadaceae bacterium]
MVVVPTQDWTAGEWSSWPAPAKLNLFLRIVGRRLDGYHQLQTIFQLLEWGDSLRLRVRADGVIRRVALEEGSGDYGVAEDADLALRAARLLQAESGCPLGCDLAVVKRVPLGGGFGGGSSDAGTVLVVLDRLWKTDLGVHRLAAMGLKLGADVPVFVHGHNAWAEGVGECLTPIALPPRWYLIVDPSVHVPTAELFQSSDLTRDAAPVTMRGFASASALGNAFEPVLRRREPKIAATLDALAQFGTACLTGSGGGCFVAFDAIEPAESALAMLPKHWKAWIAAGAPRSPLLGRLEQMH